MVPGVLTLLTLPDSGDGVGAHGRGADDMGGGASSGGKPFEPWEDDSIEVKPVVVPPSFRPSLFFSCGATPQVRPLPAEFA